MGEGCVDGISPKTLPPRIAIWQKKTPGAEGQLGNDVWVAGDACAVTGSA